MRQRVLFPYLIVLLGAMAFLPSRAAAAKSCECSATCSGGTCSCNFSGGDARCKCGCISGAPSCNCDP